MFLAESIVCLGGKLTPDAFFSVGQEDDPRGWRGRQREESRRRRRLLRDRLALHSVRCIFPCPLLTIFQCVTLCRPQ
jgi:hypothetical protein